MTHKRRNYFINPKFQLRMIGWCSLLFMIIISIFAAANWYFFRELNLLAFQAGLAEGHVFFEFIENQKVMMFRIFIFASFLSLITIVFAGIYITHRISGPIYKLTEHFKKSHPGSLQKVMFRKGDYFQELKDAYNDYIEKMK